MRRTPRGLALALAAVLVACSTACSKSGGGGASGPVGTWTIDAEKTMGPAFDVAKTEMRKGLAGLTDEQRKAAEKLMPSDDKIRDMVRDQFAKMKGTFVLNADGTATMDFEMGADKESGTATWAEVGGKYVITPKTKDGKPVEGKDAETHTLEMKDGALSFDTGEAGQTIWLKRK